MADVRALFKQRAEAWVRRDPAALAEGYAEHAAVSSPMFPRAMGRAAIEQSYVSLFRIFPDWEMTFEEPCIDGNRAMQACTVRATQIGEFMGIPGSGRRVQFACVLIFDLSDGLIVQERRVYDFTGILIQLGILRGKPAV